MSDFAYALSQGLAAGAKTGGEIVGDQMRIQQQADAEQRAADIKLDTASRMMAIEQAMKTRAAERFSTIAQQKAGEQVPVDPATVNETGITHASGAQAVGMMDYGNGPEAASGISADPAALRQIVTKYQAVLTDPAATPEQKADAQALLDQIGKQASAQSDINTKAAKGKTRKRTAGESMKAALDDPAALADPEAFMAGTGMLSAYNKLDDEDARLDVKKSQIAERLDASKSRTDMMGEIAKMRLEQAQAAGSKGGQLPSDAKMINYLVEQGEEYAHARDLVMGTGAGATKDPVSMAASLASGLIASGAVRVTKDDPPGTTVASKAMNMASDQIQAAEARFRGKSPAAAAAKTTPNPFDTKPGAAKKPDPLGLFSN